MIDEPSLTDNLFIGQGLFLLSYGLQKLLAKFYHVGWCGQERRFL